MKNNSSIKESLIKNLKDILRFRAEEASNAMESARESRNSDTKSSAGDKFETGRAMIQMEMDKSQAQLASARMLQQSLASININKKFIKVEPGSLVRTNQGSFFISIGMGKIELDKEAYFCISLSSPIGEMLRDKTQGESFEFHGKTFNIVEIN